MRSLIQLRRSRAYSLAFVTSLAIGIAATCTAFAVVKRAFIDALPYPEDDRLVTIRTVVDGRASLGSSFRFGEALRGSAAFTDVASDWGRTVTYESPHASERLSAGAVTPNYFAVLGIAPAIGRTLAPGADDEVVVSWGFFERALGGDPGALETALVLDGVARRVVGVMPRTFVGPYLTEAVLWLPLDTRPFLPEPARGARGVILQTRLADGVTLEQAQAMLNVLGDAQRRQYPEAFARHTWIVERLRDVLIEPSRTVLMATAAATVLLMVIVLANVTGLAAARAAEMRKAAAVRLALGSGQARLLKERLAESAALAAAGTAGGLWFATLFIEWVVRYQQQFQLFLEDVPVASLDLTVAGTGVALGAVTAAVAAIVPQRAIRDVTADELLGSGRGFGGAKSSRARGALVVVQVAVAVVLLFSAGLLVRTVQSITSGTLGFSTDRLASFDVVLPAGRYGDVDRVRQFEASALERLRTVDGIEGATATFRMPGLGGPELPVTLPGASEPEPMRAVSFVVAPGFFAFLRTAMVDGREFTAADRGDSPAVAVINQLMARAFFPSGNALGARLRLGGAGSPPRDVIVVGIVADVRQSGWGREIQPTVFESTLQRVAASRNFVIRSSRPEGAIAADVRAAVHAIDPLLALTAISRVDARIDSQIVQQRFVRALLTIFAAIAAGLCALGLFAVVSLTAQARRREFAMRMALGARDRDVAWIVLRQSLVLGAIGGAIGLAASTWLAGALGAMLHGVTSSDPPTLAVTAGTVVALAIAAALPPALRAAHIDPVQVLKES